MKNRKAAIFLIVYLSILVCFAGWYLLDTFVLEQALQAVEETPEPAAQPYSITMREEVYEGTLLHIADVRLNDVHQLQTAFARDTYGRNITETVYDMAERHGAALAINGDYYGAARSGYVIRNGELYRSTASYNQQDLCVWPDGSLSLISERNTTAQELIDDGVWQVFSFGPGLIDQGNILVTSRTEVGKAMVSNPRTAIAMLEPLHYLFVVSDGRTQESEGLSLLQLAQWLADQGAQVAYNLDGGGSSTMVYGHEVINFPTTYGNYQERTVSDIVYIAGE